MSSDIERHPATNFSRRKVGGCQVFPTSMWAPEATTNESEGHWWFICDKVVNTRDGYLGNWQNFSHVTINDKAMCDKRIVSCLDAALCFIYASAVNLCRPYNVAHTTTQRQHTCGGGWTLVCPTAQGFRKVSITMYLPHIQHRTINPLLVLTPIPLLEGFQTGKKKGRGTSQDY